MVRARTAGPAPAVDRHGRPVSVAYRRRRRERIGSGGSAIGAGAGLLARMVHVVVGVVVLIIVAGILLVVLKANPTNTIVSDVHGWAHSLVGPFDGIFSFHNAHVAIAVNWGIAAAIYLLVGVLTARLIGRSHRR